MAAKPSEIEIGWFFRSIEKGAVEHVALFLDTYGVGAANIADPATGEPPLHLAVKQHVVSGAHAPVISLLLEKEINPMLKNTSGLTALQYVESMALVRRIWNREFSYEATVAQISAYEAKYKETMFTRGISHPLAIPKVTAKAKKPAP